MQEQYCGVFSTHFILLLASITPLSSVLVDQYKEDEEAEVNTLKQKHVFFPTENQTKISGTFHFFC